MSALRALAVCAVVSAASVSWASVLDDTPTHYPWFKSSGGAIVYNAGTGTLDVVSYGDAYNVNGTESGGLTLDPGASWIELHVIIDPITKTVSANTAFEPDNDWFYSSAAFFVTGGGDPVGDVFKSDRPVEFDFNLANQGQISFRFLQDGDMVAPNNEPVVLHLTTANVPAGLGASFDSRVDGDNSAMLYGDAFYMPEPITLVALGAGGLMLLGRRRTR